MTLKLGKFGAYLSCSNYPDCTHKAQVGEAANENAEPGEGEMALPKALGNDPESDEPITLKKGPYGVYVQRGEGKTPKRASLLKGMEPSSMTLELALSLLSLPKLIGVHSETGSPIEVGTGKFGPYLKHEGKFTSLPPGEDPLTIGLNRAMDILLTPKAAKGGRGAAAAPLKTLGNHPDGNPVTLHSGQYGPYVKHGKTNATLPKTSTPDEVTLEGSAGADRRPRSCP